MSLVTILTTIRDYFNRQEEVRLIYLLGSGDVDTTTPETWYHIVLLTKEHLSAERRAQMECDVTACLEGRTVHLNPLKYGDDKAYTIVVEGYCVFDDNLAVQASLESDLLNRYDSEIRGICPPGPAPQQWQNRGNPREPEPAPADAPASRYVARSETE
jgi:hypothetical protein